jgi:alcohol dehydrogenase YqhD (iron-dependent ADH family)
MTYVLDHKVEDNYRFVQFATRIWGCQMNHEDTETTAREGIEAFKSFVKELGMPTTIGEIGGKPEDAPKLAQDMFFEAPNHGNFIKLTLEIAEEIYRMAM